MLEVRYLIFDTRYRLYYNLSVLGIDTHRYTNKYYQESSIKSQESRVKSQESSIKYPEFKMLKITLAFYPY